MPNEKENEVREKGRLAMERVRHGPDIATDIAIDPNKVDDISSNGPNSSSTDTAKRFSPMDPTQVPTST